MRFFDGVFSAPRWRALWAAQLGFLLDAMDVLLYVFALATLRTEFGWTNAQAGLAASATLLASAVGGVTAGFVSDRIGRRRTLMYTILLYSLASAGTATSRGLGELIFWRALVGLGLGGEWSAGATLVAEWWPAGHRAKAASFMQSGWALGYMAAAGLTALILPRFGWRALFLAGVLPALLTLYVRRHVEEPQVWREQRARAPWNAIFRPPLARFTVLATALATSVLFAYWGLFTWLPGFLSLPANEGGAGMTVVRTSGFVFAVQAGAFAGYLCFGVLADRFGRRPAFAVYVLAAALLAPLYGMAPRRWPDLLFWMGPLVGFFGTGFFSLFGAMLAELYPTAVRGAGQGFAYNFGRGLSALAPVLVGALADRHGVGAALAVNSGFFVAAAALVFLLPETKSTDLAAVGGPVKVSDRTLEYPAQTETNPGNSPHSCGIQGDISLISASRGSTKTQFLADSLPAAAHGRPEVGHGANTGYRLSGLFISAHAIVLDSYSHNPRSNIQFLDSFTGGNLLP